MLKLKYFLDIILSKNQTVLKSELMDKMKTREILFKAPLLSKDFVKAIKRITPHSKFKSDEESRVLWEMDQNVSCWTEYEAIAPYLMKIASPRRVLDIGPGFGRSVAFFSKKLNWNNAEFYLFEGEEGKVRYTKLGPRFEDSFCGNFDILRRALEYNKITNYKILNASEFGYRLANIKNTFDVIYSLYAVGYHWSLEYFLDEILGLMDAHSIAFFTVPSTFKEFEALKKVNFTVAHSVRLSGETVRILVISKSPLEK